MRHAELQLLRKVRHVYERELLQLREHAYTRTTAAYAGREVQPLHARLQPAVRHRRHQRSRRLQHRGHTIQAKLDAQLGETRQQQEREYVGCSDASVRTRPHRLSQTKHGEARRTSV